mmetsp:Transcript_26004/g.4450  ORF Transcript_26004/g.4450 Transcript_26004/m.4450 type:complete len:98 (-) Transcript_26004:3-296(-)
MKREGIADVNPKVFEPFAPIPGRAPRKVVIDRKKKRYASIDIEELLREFGVDYGKASEAWLDLVSFDDCDYEERNNEEWVLLGRQSEDFEAIPGLGL